MTVKSNFSKLISERLATLAKNNVKQSNSVSFGSLTGTKNSSSVFQDTASDIENIDYELLAEAIKEGNLDGIDDKTTKGIASIVNELLAIEEINNAVDASGDGEINAAEMEEFIKGMAGGDGDAKTITMDDINALVKEMDVSLDKVVQTAIQDALTEMTADEEDEDGIDISKKDKTEKEKEAEEAKRKAEEEAKKAAEAEKSQSSGGTSGGGGVSGGGGGVSGGGVSGGGTKAASSSSNAKSGSIDSMSLDQLQSELNTRKTTLSEKQKELSEANSGETAELKSLKQEEDKAYKEYLEEMKKEAPALSDSLRTVKANMEKEEKAISDCENEINTQSSEIDNQQANIDNASARISSLDNAIATATANLSSVEDDSKKQSIQSQIEAYKTDKAQAENDKKEAEAAKKKAEEAKKKAETEKKEHEAELQKLQTEMDKIQKEVEENDKLKGTKEKQAAYNEAKQAFQTAKTSAVSQAQSAVNEAQKAVTEVQNKITQVQSKAIEASAKLSDLGGTYNHNGAQYNTVLGQEDLDALVKAAAAGGAGTGFGHPDKCLSIAFSYGLWATGDSNRAYSDSGVWEYGDNGAYQRFCNDDKSVVLAEIKKELDEGRPCVLQVNGSSQNSRHYVTVLGYKSSAGDTLDESDLLIWDSYNSTIRDCGMGSSGGRNMIQGYATCHGGYGWEIYKRKS